MSKEIELKKSEKLDIAVMAALTAISKYITGNCKNTGFAITRKKWYVYIKITSWTMEKVPMIGLSTGGITIKKDADSEWETVYDFSGETDKKIIEKESIRTLNEIFHNAGI